MNNTKDKNMYRKNNANYKHSNKSENVEKKPEGSYYKSKKCNTRNESHKKSRNNYQEYDYKNTERKHKKRKKFLTIIVFIFIVLATFFIVRMNENGWTYGGFLATVLGHNSKTAESMDTIYIVVTGQSQNLTDSIMVCAYNPSKNKASIMSIPRDTFIGDSEKKASSSDKINTLYNKSPEKLVAKINELTGLNIKYYMNIDTKSLRDLVDSIGGVYYDVPIDMDYDDDTQNLHIHLTAGYQLLDGSKTEQLLRFRHNNDGSSYPASYGDNDIGRMRTQREFIKVLYEQLSEKKSISNLVSYIKILKSNVTTNFNLNSIIHYVPYMLDFNMENLQTTTLPGESKKCNGVWLYIQDKKETKTLVDSVFDFK